MNSLRVMARASYLLAVVFNLSSCTSVPLDSDSVNTTLTPAAVTAAADSAKGTVMWGGVILSSVNLVDSTQFEVLAYPLDRRQRPMTAREAQGRFLVQSPGYVETVDYAAGRQLTVLGMLEGVTHSTVGEASFDFPMVKATEIHLWTGDGRTDESHFSFGIGVNLSN